MSQSTRSSRGAKRNKVGNIWVFVQLIFCPGWPTNQLYKNPNIAYLVPLANMFRFAPLADYTYKSMIFFRAGFDAYPAMTAAYVVGYMIGIVYAFDFVACLRSWRRERAQGF